MYSCTLLQSAPSRGICGTTFHSFGLLEGNLLRCGLVGGSCSMQLHSSTDNTIWRNARICRSCSSVGQNCILQCGSHPFYLHYPKVYHLGTTGTCGQLLHSCSRSSHYPVYLNKNRHTLGTLSREVSLLSTLVAPAAPFCHPCWYFV